MSKEKSKTIVDAVIDNVVQKVEDMLKGPFTFESLFDDEFMSTYTNYSTIQQFLSENNIPTDEKGFANFPDEEMDKIVAASTQFQTWEEMKNRAGIFYAKKQLGI